jgi:hypothetical protein
MVYDVPGWFSKQGGMGSIAGTAKAIRITVRAQDAIRWNQFLRGGLSHLWMDAQELWLVARTTRYKKSSLLWMSWTVEAALQISWEMWEHRNAVLHPHTHGIFNVSRTLMTVFLRRLVVIVNSGVFWQIGGCSEHQRSIWLRRLWQKESNNGFTPFGWPVYNKLKPRSSICEVCGYSWRIGWVTTQAHQIVRRYPEVSWGSKELFHRGDIRVRKNRYLVERSESNQHAATWTPSTMALPVRVPQYTGAWGVH